MKVFKLRLSDWLRGASGWFLNVVTGDGECISRLLNCVGQMLEQAGVPRDVLLDKLKADELEDVPAALGWLVDIDKPSYEAEVLYGANDSELSSDDRKIEVIREIIGRHGIELEVVD